MADNPIATVGPAIVEALKKGNKIEAIKLMRQASGLGLAEAKQFIDRYEATQLKDKLKVETAARTVAPHSAPAAHVYKPRPGLSPGQVAPSGGGPIAAVLVAVITAGVVAAYFLMR